jgi:hypothetical protein
VGGRKPTLKKLRWSINVNLKVSKEEYLVVDYMDFDEFVTEVYGLKDRFCCAAEGEFNNDSCYQFTAEKEEIDEYYLNALPNNDNRWISLDTVFTDLCNKDLIEEGNYLLTVCW